MDDLDTFVAKAREAAMAEANGLFHAKNGLKRQRSESWGEEDRPLKQTRAEEKDEPSLNFNGLKVRNPVVCVLDGTGDVVPLAWPPPGIVDHGPLVLPDHYVVVGDIKLFGLVDATISVFQGCLTPGHPYSEIVTPKVSALSASTFLPSLKDSPLDSIALENLRFTYSEVSFDTRQSAGLYLETDVVFCDDLQPVADILRDFFRQEHPALHVSAYLGSERNWILPLSTVEIVLRGSLEGTNVNVLDVLTFTRVGVEVGFCQRADDDNTGGSAWRRTYGFFGDLHLKVPGSVVPLQVQYKLTVGTGHYILFVLLKDDEWKDVFGVNGLSLRDVQMTAILANLDEKAELQFRVQAALDWNDAQLLMSGSYSKTEYSLDAYIGDLSLKELGKLFKRVTDYELEAFDHDVVFDSISLCISSDGLVLSGAVTVDGYSTACATIAIAGDGVHITGGVGSDLILPALQSNKCYLHCCLSVAAQHLKAVLGSAQAQAQAQGQPGQLVATSDLDADIMRHRYATISTLCHALPRDENHQQVLESALALIFFQCGVGRFDDALPDVPWHQHFQAAASLVQKLNLPAQVTAATTAPEEVTPVAAGDAVAVVGAESQTPFNMTLMSWVDILGATMQGRAPVFAHTYREKHLSPPHLSSLGLRELMGCEDRVMYLISEIACLEALKASGMDDIMLCHHVSVLGDQIGLTEVGEAPAKLPFNANGSLSPKQLSKNMTAAFRLAARIYLCSLVPGFCPSQISCRNLVDKLTAVLQTIPCGPAGFDRCVVWVYLMAGFASMPGSTFRVFFADRIAQMGDNADVGSFGRVVSLLHEVWLQQNVLIQQLAEEKEQVQLQILQRRQQRKASSPNGGEDVAEDNEPEPMMAPQYVHWREVMHMKGWDFLLM